MGLIRNVVKGAIEDLVDETKRTVRSETRRASRKTFGGYVQKAKQKVVKKVKVYVDDFTEKHPSKAKLEAKEEVLAVAEAEAKEMIETGVVVEKKAPEETTYTEPVRRLELD